jgi:hypothetical protein
MRRSSGWTRWLLGVCLTAACAVAQAHDSWLSTAGSAQSGRVELHMATGERYPLASSAPAATSLAQAGCVDGRGRTLRLRPGREQATALTLQATRRGSGPLACWVELAAHDITLEPTLVAVYLREIQPPDAVRQAWAAQQEHGLPWQERYRKFARIEVSGAQHTPQQLRAIRAPRGQDLEIVVLGDTVLRSGQPARFQVLSRGVPVPGLAVELVSERSAIGVWGRSDAEGQLGHILPFAGAWLLRATLLERGARQGEWQSRFVTLAFEVRP